MSTAMTFPTYSVLLVIDHQYLVIMSVFVDGKILVVAAKIKV